MGRLRKGREEIEIAEEKRDKKRERGRARRRNRRNPGEACLWRRTRCEGARTRHRHAFPRWQPAISREPSSSSGCSFDPPRTPGVNVRTHAAPPAPSTRPRMCTFVVIPMELCSIRDQEKGPGDTHQSKPPSRTQVPAMNLPTQRRMLLSASALWCSSFTRMLLLFPGEDKDCDEDYCFQLVRSEYCQLGIVYLFVRKVWFQEDESCLVFLLGISWDDFNRVGNV